MLHTVLSRLEKPLTIGSVFAHCDIPCKIYDPINAQIAALTLIRMVDLIGELSKKETLSVKDHAELVRLINEKETQGLVMKNEVSVIWGDYFKQPQFDVVPEVHELVHSIMMQASKAKQNVDRNHALALLELVNQFAEAFWKTKGVDTFTGICPYPPAESVVYPVIAKA